MKPCRKGSKSNNSHQRSHLPSPAPLLLVSVLSYCRVSVQSCHCPGPESLSLDSRFRKDCSNQQNLCLTCFQDAPNWSRHREALFWRSPLTIPGPLKLWLSSPCTRCPSFSLHSPIKPCMQESVIFSRCHLAYLNPSEEFPWAQDNIQTACHGLCDPHDLPCLSSHPSPAWLPRSR